MNHSLPLPTLPPAAAEHERQMRRYLRDLIDEAGGSITFARYMEAVLYAPGLGYYSAGSRKLGADGDFVTAPEISPLFGRCIARNVAPWLAELGGGEVLEAGAGSGALAAQILSELAALGAPCTRYLILERSADLRERQRAVLGRFGQVDWLDGLPEPGFRGVVVANELLDALPAARFRVESRGISEEYVRSSGEALERCFGPPSTPSLESGASELMARLPEPLAPGYVSELSPVRAGWIASVADTLAAGAVILVDYGYPRSEYYHPQRTAGTLRCHLGHRAHDDPLLHPGVQDVSVHVDFSAVAAAARAAGLEVAGFTTQAEFLLASGLLEFAAEVEAGTAEYLRVADAIKTLTLPGQMGDAAKVMVLVRGVGSVAPGLGGRDHSVRL